MRLRSLWRPILEQLEDRRLLACDVSLSRDGMLLVIGDETDNVIEIVGTDRGVQVTCDGQTEIFANVSAVQIDALNGADEMKAPSALFGYVESPDGSTNTTGVGFDGGDGIDKLLVTAAEARATWFDIAPGLGANSFRLDVTDIPTNTSSHIVGLSIEDLVIAEHTPGSKFLKAEIDSPGSTYRDFGLGVGDESIEVVFDPDNQTTTIEGIECLLNDCFEMLVADSDARTPFLQLSSGGRDKLIVEQGDGDDSATIDNTSGLLSGIAIQISGQGGDDTTTLTILPPPSDQELDPETLDWEDIGGPGNDKLVIDATATDIGQQFQIRAGDEPGSSVTEWSGIGSGPRLGRVLSVDVESTTIKGSDGDDEFRVAGFLPTVLHLFGEGGNDSTEFFAFGSSATLEPAEPLSPDGGEGEDKFILIATDAADLIDILGVQPDPQRPDPLIRGRNRATGELLFEVSVFETEDITVDTAGGPDHVLVRDPDGLLGGIDWNIITGDGNDLIDVLATTGTGPALWNIDAGAGHDLVCVRFSGAVSGDVRVTVNGQAGNDLLAVELLFAELGSGLIDIRLAGGLGNDVLALIALGCTDPRRTRLLVDGGSGFDVGIGTLNVDIVGCEIVIGGRRRR